MTRLIFLLTLSVFLSQKLKAQFINGAYKNCVEFNTGKTTCEAKFIFLKTDNLDIPDLYELRTSDKKVTRLMIDKMFWGIYIDSIFYLNAKRIGMTDGYIKLGKLKPYLYFKGTPITTLNQRNALKNAILYQSTIQTLNTSIRIHKENKNKVHYVFNYKTGMINLLNPLFMQRVLLSSEVLSERYNNEPDKESVPIMLTYLSALNKLLMEEDTAKP